MYQHRDSHNLLNFVVQLLQQHINRNAQRLAQMKGHTSPSKEELDLAMHKRVLSVERPFHKNGSVNQPRDGVNVPLDLDLE